MLDDPTWVHADPDGGLCGTGIKVDEKDPIRQGKEVLYPFRTCNESVSSRVHLGPRRTNGGSRV